MKTGNIKIRLDKAWNLRDFSTLGREYVQLYSFFYALEIASEEGDNNIDVSTYPWKGGYSVVNFFQRVYGVIKKDHRLNIIRIEYGSPGVIELSGVLSVATNVSALIGTICGSIYAINKTYQAIYDSYIRRKLAKLKIHQMESKLKKDDIRFIIQSVKELCHNFKLTKTQVSALEAISDYDELIQLKILLALYRRAKLIADNQKKGKTKL